MEAINTDRQLLDAFGIARLYFSQFTKTQILGALMICQKNGGLYVSPDKATLFAHFRYHPLSMVDSRRMLAVVQEFDLETLRLRDLTRGPCLHLVAFVAPTDAYKVFRSGIDVLNPFTISAHRWNHGAFRFRLKKNPHYKSREHDENQN